MEAFLWDNQSRLLEHIGREVAGTEGQLSMKRSLAQFYTLRVLDRTQALSRLFEGGHYVPAMSVVRTAYEDWLASATVLLPSSDDDEVALRSLNELGAEYTRLYRRFQALSGKRAAKAQFPVHPEYARQFLEAPSDPRHAIRNWRQKAVALGLETVHDVAYNYMSDIAHGSFHAMNVYVRSEGGVTSPRMPQRDPDGEELSALWAFWFHLRTLTVSGQQWGRDYEYVSTEFLDAATAERKHRTLGLSVMRRETWTPDTA